MTYINWNPEKDPYLKKGEVEIHSLLHNKQSSNTVLQSDLKSRHRWRAIALDLAIEAIGSEWSGKILDIGCGTGWSSAFLATKPKVECIYAMECNLPAVTKLIPKMFDIFDISKDKYKIVLGSFNKIPVKNEFDFIVSMGALHHSANLYHTFTECYKALKPGGWVIASEPVSPNYTTNKEFMNRYNGKKNFRNMIELREDERDDHFYRLCEWETAAYHAGFDVFPLMFHGSGRERYKKTTLPQMCYRGYDKIIFRPTIRSTNVDELLLLARKPKKEGRYVPHRWEDK